MFAPAGIGAIDEGYNQGAVSYWQRRNLEDANAANQTLGRWAQAMSQQGGPMGPTPGPIPQGAPPPPMAGPGGMPRVAPRRPPGGRAGGAGPRGAVWFPRGPAARRGPRC